MSREVGKTDEEQLRGILHQFTGPIIAKVVSEMGIYSSTPFQEPALGGHELIGAAIILDRLGVPKELSIQMLGYDPEENRGYAEGNVVRVTTVPGLSKVKVIRDESTQPTQDVLFMFPPNKQEAEEEFDVARIKGTKLKVHYHKEGGQNIISGIDWESESN